MRIIFFRYIGDAKLVEVGEDISKALVLHQRKNYSSVSIALIKSVIVLI